MRRGTARWRARRGLGGRVGLGLAVLLAACGDDGIAGTESDGATTSATATTGAATTGAATTGTDTEPSTSTSAGTESDSGELDILDKLEAIDGMRVIERFDSDADGRFFELYYRLPVDHDDPDDPDAGDFELFMTLIHRSEAAPTVFFTTGYHNYYYDYEFELSWRVGGNQLAVEKRFTGVSKPDADWVYLDAAQVAADGHAIVDALRPIYGGPWLRTGASLGGEDAVYHHYFFPEDFDGVVAYVAPFVLGLADARFVDHFYTAVPQPCQADLEALQAALLGPRRADMVDALAASLDADALARIGGHDRALQTLVLELPWSLWQAGDESTCLDVPAADDPNISGAAHLQFIDDVVGVDAVTDDSFATYEAYAYQAFTQLGRPAVPLDHLDGLVDPDYVDLETGMPPTGVPLPFDAALLPAIHAWAGAGSEASRLIFIYGDYDPWAAGRIDVSGNPAVTSYHDPTGNHGTKIGDLAASDRAQVEATLEAWIGAPLGGRPPPDPRAEPRLRLPR